MKEEMKRKIISIGIVGCLLLTGLLSVSTVGMELRVEDVDQNDATKNIESDTVVLYGYIYEQGSSPKKYLGDVTIQHVQTHLLWDDILSETRSSNNGYYEISLPGEGRQPGELVRFIKKGYKTVDECPPPILYEKGRWQIDIKLRKASGDTNVKKRIPISTVNNLNIGRKQLSINTTEDPEDDINAVLEITGSIHLSKARSRSFSMPLLENLLARFQLLGNDRKLFSMFI